MGEQDRRLALIELLERDGRVRQSIEVRRWPVTIGRAFDNDVVLDDPFVALRHVRIDAAEDGQLRLEVLEGVRNPLTAGGRALAAGASAALPREAWSVGSTALRVRWPGETLAPERPIVRARSKTGLAVLGLLLWAMLLAEMALAQDPGARLSSWLVPVLSAPFALIAWAGLWGLLTKLFRHQFEFWPHASIAVRWALASTVLRWGLPMLAFAMSWSWLLAPAAIISIALFFGMVRSHALRVLPGRRRSVTAVLLFGLLALLSVQAIGQHQATDRWFGPLYLSQLGPPALRLAPAVPVPQFIDDAGRLGAELLKNAAADKADDEDIDEP